MPILPELEAQIIRPLFKLRKQARKTTGGLDNYALSVDTEPPGDPKMGP